MESEDVFGLMLALDRLRMSLRSLKNGMAVGVPRVRTTCSLYSDLKLEHVEIMPPGYAESSQVSRWLRVQRLSNTKRRPIGAESASLKR